MTEIQRQIIKIILAVILATVIELGLYFIKKIIKSKRQKKEQDNKNK